MSETDETTAYDYMIEHLDASKLSDRDRAELISRSMCSAMFSFARAIGDFKYRMAGVCRQLECASTTSFLRCNYGYRNPYNRR